MTIVVSIFVALLFLLCGLLFFSNSKRGAEKVSKEVDYKSFVDSINHEIAVENKSLAEENEELNARVDFFKWLFIRQFIVEYEHTLLRAGNHLIFTSDALENLKAWAETALKNYQDRWGGESCNEYCDWTKEFLQYLIDWINKGQEDEWRFYYIDDEYEMAFMRFFEYFNNSPSSDELHKAHNKETTELDYWRPQGRCFEES